MKRLLNIISEDQETILQKEKQVGRNAKDFSIQEKFNWISVRLSACRKRCEQKMNS